jgi:hypothetical protein
MEKAFSRKIGKLKPESTTEFRSGVFVGTQAPNRSAARAFALAASTSRSLGGALVSSEWRRRVETAAISSTAAWKRASLAFDGLWIPLIFRTNCSEDARTSSEVTGGSKLKSVLIFLHMDYDLKQRSSSTPSKHGNVRLYSGSGGQKNPPHP